MGEITFAAISDIGKTRKVNQDRWLADPEQGLYLVADGLGGHAAGDVAAQFVVELFPKVLRDELTGISDLAQPEAAQAVSRAVEKVSQRLWDAAAKRASQQGMGSTIVLALVRESRALIAHLGDSRAYLRRGNDLRPITNDHSLVQLLLDSGRISATEAARHPSRGKLLRFAGMSDPAVAEVQLLDLQSGDRVLMCSDGLSGMLNDAQMEFILRVEPELEKACDSLVAAANEAGGRDNITALMVAIDDLS
ncbi:MAG: protein phosphatase 2C domain-containing protein [Planctomycetales bacterium]